VLRKDIPDHHDADLILKLYELRREPVMRASREAVMATFWPRSIEDVMAVMGNRGHALNAALRQTTTYWEMVYSFARHGIVEPEFLLESTGEGLFLFARIEPFLEPLRQATNPRSLRNAEWMAQNTTLGRDMMEIFRKRVATETGKAKAKAEG
jgi:hypothetical protein